MFNFHSQFEGSFIEGIGGRLVTILQVIVIFTWSSDNYIGICVKTMLILFYFYFISLAEEKTDGTAIYRGKSFDKPSLDICYGQCLMKGLL